MNRTVTHNYHTHTARCGHAEGPDRAYVEAAIAAGVKELGFSDHVPYPYMMDGYYSSFRMKPEETEGYVKSLRALQEEFKGQIDIKIGYEAEYYPDVYDAMISHLEEYGYDYLILGEHYLWNSRELHGSEGWTDDEKWLATYVELILEGLSKGKYSYLCHPDLLHYEGDEKIYDKHYRLLCKECKKMDIPLEVNMWGFVTNRHYPSDKFFRIAKEEGNKVIVGCDAHNPRVFGNQEVYTKVFDFIEKNELNLIEGLNLK